MDKYIEFKNHNTVHYLELEYYSLKTLKELRPVAYYDKIWIRQLIRDIMRGTNV